MLINDVNKVKVGNIVFGGKKRFVLIAGPCVMESQELMLEVAGEISALCKKLGIEDREIDLTPWKEVVDKIKNPKEM